MDEALAAKRAQQAAQANIVRTPSTKTTITRRDEGGNVVDVQQSETTVETPVAKPQPHHNRAQPSEIHDPFN